MPLIGKPGERIGYAVHEGPAEAPPIFLLHGFTASAASFSTNIAGLTRHFRVVTVDLLGHGESDSPEDPAPYAPGPAMDRLEDLFDHLGYDRVLLCGHSLGGALALRFAIERPHRLEGLIVINSSSASGTPVWRETVAPRLGEMGARVRAEGIDFLRRSATYPAASRRLPPAARDQLAADFDRLEPAGVAGTAEALIVNVNAFERIPELTMPTLLVFGDRDADVMSFAPGFVAAVPEGVRRVVTIAGAGHAANLERPDVFDPAVASFAREIGYLPTETGGVFDTIRRSMLAVVGGVLVTGGVALVIAAFFFGGSDRNAEAVRDTPASATATRAAATATPGRSPAAIATVAGAQVTSTIPATTAPNTAPPPTPRPAATPADTAIAPATPAPSATPTPTATQPPTATPTPTGPYVTLTGPASAATGTVVTFSASAYAPAPLELLTVKWIHPGGDGGSGQVIHALQVSYATPGCYTVTVTAYFTGGATATASRSVSIGGVGCGLG